MCDDLQQLPSVVRGGFGRVHEHHASVGSTNDHALEWAKRGAPHGAVVTADTQTAGRGRRGRSWSAAPGQNLCVSGVVRPGAPREDFAAVSLAVGLGLVRGLGVEAVQLKWPNDLVLEGRKLGGVLCETRWHGGRPELVAGFGINVHQTRFAGELANTATSLAAHGVARARTPLLADLLLALEGTLAEFAAAGFGALREGYLARCSLRGQAVLATASGQAVRGVVQTVDDAGALVLRTDDGATLAVSTGEVERVRPSLGERVR